MNYSKWKEMKEKEEVCLCGHLMENHKDYWGKCTVCNCIEYEVRNHD